MAITFVGSVTGRQSTDFDLDLPTLNEGDVVLVGVSCDGLTPALPNDGATDYTNIVNSSDALPSYQLSYKVMGSTPDTSVTISAFTGSPARVSVAVVMCFRGVNTANIFDATTTTASGAGDPNAPSITTVSNEAAVVAWGFLDDSNTVSVSIAGYDDLDVEIASQSASTSCSTMAAWTTVSSPSAENPPTFVTEDNDAWHAASIALRPSSLAVATGTVAVLSISAPTKQSTAAVTGTSQVASISASTKAAPFAGAGTSTVSGVAGFLAAATGTVAVSASGEATKQSVGALTGTVSAQEPASQATKASVGTATGTSVASAELEGFKIFQIHPTGTATVSGVAGFIGAATGTVALVGDSAANKLATFTEAGTSTVQEPASQALKASLGAIAGTSAVLSTSNATKKAVGLVAASQTVAAVSGTTLATKQSIAAVSENISVVLGIGTSKLSIHPKTVLNAVSDPSSVTLHDLPDPVPLTIV